MNFKDKNEQNRLIYLGKLHNATISWSVEPLLPDQKIKILYVQNAEISFQDKKLQKSDRKKIKKVTNNCCYVNY